MRYLLDTIICIYLIKKNPESVIKKFRNKKPGQILISAITVSELYYGVAKSARQRENTVALKEFLAPLVVIEFNEDDAIAYGSIRADLEKKGKAVGAMDMLIAAQAVMRDIILVTNNAREFSHIRNLKVENWI